MKTVLVQLIGDQTIPNILPVVNLEPDIVYNISTDRTNARGQAVEKWIRGKFPGQVQSHLKNIGTDDLDAKVMEHCLDLAERHRDKQVVFNMTGGTKLMALAMYQAAEKLPGIPVLYVDENAQGDPAKVIRWVLGADSDFVRATAASPVKRLCILDILEVGEQDVVYKSVKDWHKKLPAAHLVQRLGSSAHCLRKLRAAVKADPALLESFSAAACNLDRDDAMSHSFITGGWWEVLVAEHLEQSGLYTEVLSSIQTVISRGDPDLAEVDVLATDGFTLTSYSCKRSVPPKPDTEINKHEARSRKLGGSSTKCGIAVYNDEFGPLASLVQMAKAQKCDILLGAMVCPGMPWPEKPEDHAGDDADLLEKLFPKNGVPLEQSFFS